MSNNQNNNNHVSVADYMAAFRLFDNSSIPTEIFAPDGTAIYANQAGLDFNGIKDASLIIGKYNLLQCKKCNDEMGKRDDIRKLFFNGEACSWLDTIVPIEDLVNRGVIDAKLFEAAYIDYHLHPVMDGGKVLYVVFQFTLKRIYKGQPDVARAKEYIDNHWWEKYDDNALAEAVNLSVSQLGRIFKKHTGMSPGDYYKEYKVSRIKEKLADRNLSITQAFAACGEDSRGGLAKTFRKVTGMSPKEYRDTL